MCGIVLCFKKCQQQICEAISVKGALASSATPLRAPLCLMCLDLKKCAQNEMKCSRFLFFFLLELIFLEFFFGKVCSNSIKNPSHPQKFVCSFTCNTTRPFSQRNLILTHLQHFKKLEKHENKKLFELNGHFVRILTGFILILFHQFKKFVFLLEFC